jgi:peptidoglycan/xylan/chitin deacetylase (PgdA/CDA1 family)
VFISVLFVFFAALLWFVIPVVHRRIATRRLERRCVQRRAIVLTYDDGPSASVSPSLADLLRDRGVHATFFVIGRNAERHGETIDRLQREGHEIGSHTREHFNAWKVAPWRAVPDIRAGSESLRALGVTPSTFRPPFGKSTPATLLYALRTKLRLAFWTVDSRDSWDRRPVADVLESIERKGGGVVLMHDFDVPLRGPAPETHPEYLLNLTEALIDFAERRDFAILRFGDLFDSPRLEAV